MPMQKEHGTVRLTHDDWKEELEEGEFYVLREALNWSEYAELSIDKSMVMETRNMLAGRKGADDTDNMRVTMDMHQVQMKRIKTFVLEWSHNVPITEEHIGKLDPKTAKFLNWVISKLMEKMGGESLDDDDLTEREKKLFPK